MPFVRRLQSRRLYGTIASDGIKVNFTSQTSFASSLTERLLTNSTKALCCLVSQDIDALCDESARVVDDGHASFEAQHGGSET